jgi:hypothetical protein
MSNSNIDNSNFMYVGFGVLWGSVSSLAFWDALLNTSCKKKLLDYYDSAGVETMAKTIRQHVTIHKTNHYAYPVPGSEDQLIVKHYVKTHRAGLEVPTPDESFIVKVLPGFPLSGLPKFKIDQRESDFGMEVGVLKFVIALAFVIAGSALISLPLGYDHIMPFGLQWVLSVVALLLLGLPFAPCLLSRWKKAQLQQCDTQVSISAAAEATGIIRHGGDESHNNIPLVTAVPVTTNGDIEMAESCDSNDVPPPLPDALAETILNEAKCRSFQTIVARLDDFRDGMWDVRSSYVHLAASHWSGKTLTPLHGCPDTAVGNLFRGVYYIHRAWDIRGSKVARHVQRNVWPEFHRGLRIAQESLLRAAEQDPADPTPYALLAGAIAKGLELSQEQALVYFVAAIARDSTNSMAHLARLSALCEKWGGSHKAMFAFARGTMGRCPDDAYLRVILLDAFFEKWLFLNSIIGNKRKAKDYLRSPQVREETLSIYQQCLEDRVIADIAQVSYHARATKFLLSAGFENEAQCELEKLRPWRKLLFLQDQRDIVTAALRHPEVVGQCARSLQW